MVAVSPRILAPRCFRVGAVQDIKLKHCLQQHNVISLGSTNLHRKSEFWLYHIQLLGTYT